MSGDRVDEVTYALAEALLGATGSAPQLHFGSGLLLRTGTPLSDDHHEGPARDSEHVVAGFEERGLLTPDEASTWRRRLQAARGGWRVQPPADEAERAEASRHLTTLLDAVTADGWDELAALRRFNGAASLLHHLGLLVEDDVPSWAERIQDALEQDVEHETGDDDLEEHELADRGALRRVAPARPARHDGRCVTSVELYERATVINWHLLHQSPIAADDSFAAAFTVADDLGTAYAPVLPGGAGWTDRPGVVAISGSSHCPTAVPDRASRLILSQASGHWTVPLR